MYILKTLHIFYPSKILIHTKQQQQHSLKPIFDHTHKSSNQPKKL